MQPKESRCMQNLKTQYKKDKPSSIIILTNGRKIYPMNNKYKELVKQGINTRTLYARQHIDTIKESIKEEKRQALKEYNQPTITKKNTIKFTGSLGENPFVKLYKHVQMSKEDNEYTRCNI